MRTVEFTIGNDLLDKLCKVIGIEKCQCHRIVLDIAVDQIVTVHATTYAEKTIEGLDWEVGLTKVEPK